METIYFDNAATSWPKPDAVLAAMEHYFRFVGASPGRSGHRLSIEAGRGVFETRNALASLFRANDPLRIVFTKNATEALNIVVFGLIQPGDHVIVSSMEHNSVMRPLRAATAALKADLTVVPCNPFGQLDPEDVGRAIRRNTRIVFLTHASNVTGTIMPAAEVGRICREHGVLFCVDAAQSAGAVPIDVEAMNIDLLAFTGHKSLLGPQGTGGLYARKGIDSLMRPLMMGGTGSRSEHEHQPEFMPDKYESGTLNTIGLIGLGAGVREIGSIGIEKIRQRELELTAAFMEGASGISGVTVYGDSNPGGRVPVVSFNIDGMRASDVGLQIDDACGIMSRPGLHCAPSAHRTLGTAPHGTVRFSFGYFNTREQIDTALNAIEALSVSSRRKSSCPA